MKNMKSEISRREFVTNGMFSFMLLSFPFLNTIPGNNFEGKKKHPYLLFNKNDIERIKSNTESIALKEYWDSLLKTDINEDYKFLNEEIDYSKHSSDVGKVCAIMLRASLITLVLNDKKYLNLALLSIEKLLIFKEWDFFTEAGTKVIGFNTAPNAILSVCCTYDWLYNYLSPEKRKALLDAVEERGVEACYLSIYGMKNPDKVKGWNLLSTTNFGTRVDYSNWPRILNETNIKITALTGLVVGYSLLYTEGRENKKYYDMVKWGMDTSKEVFNKDGSFNEGIPYWAYTMYFYIHAVECARRHLNLDYSKIIDFKKNSEFLMKMMAPTNYNGSSYINFCDGGLSADYVPCFWIASKYNDGLAQYIAEKYNVNRDLFAFINYDPKIEVLKPSKDLLDSKFENGWIVSRTGFTEDDIVIAFRSGGPCNHEHADRNSIILNGYGERLFDDPCGAGYSSKDKKWLLRLTAAHTAVLIDGKGHQYHDGREGTNKSLSVAEIIHYEHNDNLVVLVSAATQAYDLVNSDIDAVIRTVIFVKPDILIIIDKVKKFSENSTVQVNYQIFNYDKKGTYKIIDKNKSFKIMRPDAEVFVSAYSTSILNISGQMLDIPKEFGEFPYIQVNSAENLTHEIVSFCSIKRKADPDPLIEYSKTNNTHNFILKKENKEDVKIQFSINRIVPVDIKIF
jgi:hypothetical protein